MIENVGRPSLLLTWLLDGFSAASHIEGMAKTSNRNPGGTRGKRKASEPTGARLPIRISVDREALRALDKRAIAAQAGVGIVAGWLASWLVGGSGLIHYVVTGLAGSLIGGFLLERLGIDLGIRNQTASRIATATIGAMIVVLLARIID
ncbi:GlsB/YeaQ/YmgE family stress response membrane protein [Microvirga sp. 2MCAF35]|uniref:GlsB/YeaQ/YmgE family stress response membrane protein n=1 Tax=Microvirga sp. 2MCAF35 TaxID=3232987 RepID=UPI003F95F18A